MIPVFVNSGLLFLCSFTLSTILTPCVIWVAKRTGFVAQPREDRWHKRPTALLGGIAIFLAFAIPYFSAIETNSAFLVLGLGTGAMFLLGLIDDVYELSPQGKFIGQLVIAALVVAGGIQIQGFSHPALAVTVSLFWLVAITNAINILDNMDGLAAGISLVVACSLWVYSQMDGPAQLAGPAILLAGSAAGFWVYNLNPARIFMGDSGSLFLGFLLAGLTVMGTWGHIPLAVGPEPGHYTGVTNLVLALVVPVAVMLIPLFDTALVSFSRVQTGRSILKGGRDHTSHRLAILGYSDHKTVLTLMLFSGCISAAVLYLSKVSAQGLLVLLSIVAVIALFFGIFLTHLNSTLYEEKTGREGTAGRRSLVLSAILNKKQILQSLVDTLLITLAYFTSYLLRYEGVIDEVNIGLVEKSLPLLIPIKLACFWCFGLYRGQWRYVSVEDLAQLGKAVAASSLIMLGLLLYFYRFDGFSRVVFLNDALLTLVFIGGIRLLMRLFKEHFTLQVERSHSIPILIFGAGDGGDLFIRELRRNLSHDYLPVGFIDDDPAKKGQKIHAVKVLGSRDDLPNIVKRYGVQRVFVAVMSAMDDQLEGVFISCEKLGIPCEKIRPLIPHESMGNSRTHHPESKKVVALHVRAGEKK